MIELTLQKNSFKTEKTKEKKEDSNTEDVE